ncbi:MAG: hypothetical protein I4N50_23340, partial [Rhizobium sp.]|nr:hypothetical protein QU41_06810 [Bradyrhizobium elkanii]MBK5654611.1 hypothetical protein [Rhizobium sp.]
MLQKPFCDQFGIGWISGYRDQSGHTFRLTGGENFVARFGHRLSTRLFLFKIQRSDSQFGAAAPAAGLTLD